MEREREREKERERRIEKTGVWVKRKTLAHHTALLPQ